MEIKYWDDINTVLKEIGRRIKEARIAGEISQKELSEKTGISVGTIVHIEKGHDTKFSNIITILSQLNYMTNLNVLLPEHQVDLAKDFEKEMKKQRVRKTKKKKENIIIWEEDK